MKKLPLDTVNEENIHYMLAGDQKDRLPVLSAPEARRVSSALLKTVWYRTTTNRVHVLYNEQNWQESWDWLCQRIPLELAQKLLAS